MVPGKTPTSRAPAPVGTIPRGTTNPNRLRRVDRWLAGPQSWRLRRGGEPPVVVDLGFGATPVTAVELLDPLRRVRADVEVVGIEIDPQRVATAGAYQRPGLSFALGGFEIPLAGREATIVRAFNVWRQYPVDEVPGQWAAVQGRLAPHGLLVDGTCDELGRRAAWIALDREGPAQPHPVLAVARPGAPIARRRALAQDAHPPQCPRRRHPRGAQRAGHRVVASRSTVVFRGPAALPRDGSRRRGAGARLDPRTESLACRRTHHSLVADTPGSLG